MNGWKDILIRLKDDEYSELKKIAENEDRTVTFLVRKAVRKLIESEKNQYIPSDDDIFT